MGNIPNKNPKAIEDLLSIHVFRKKLGEKEDEEKDKENNILLLGETHISKPNDYKNYLDDIVSEDKKMCLLLELGELKDTKIDWVINEIKQLDNLISDRGVRIIGCDIIRNESIIEKKWYNGR